MFAKINAPKSDYHNMKGRVIGNEFEFAILLLTNGKVVRIPHEYLVKLEK